MRKSNQTIRFSIGFSLAMLAWVAPSVAMADLERALENYLLIVKGKKKANDLSPAEAKEALEVHNRLRGFGGSRGGGCEPVIESQIDGDFEGWEGETIFKLMNGQIWQQSSYSYTYMYSFMPKVMIYPVSGGCTLKVDGVSDTITVHQIR
ncbi:hypothetical protein [Shewanella algae]|uniref:hypothetical protein n=1 Tax=Shewanella algae TaxID=38313 RepID=UPI001182916D|nr:hypothetical protein [Shewanella algae]MBO2556690.1 hypothetical protein [Shewanella algae]MBO2573624.1 hypothetical protein [Shewanella algae]MBO2637082.1 hypothetical protein [Shewanella algae]TVL40685.1 hypothetical protein AYI94_01025 [Shewanella algae]HDS1204042.1 hypothetical protein [Shewanella algae]